MLFQYHPILKQVCLLLPEEYEKYKIIYINDFVCDNTPGRKGNGRKLLVETLHHIKKKTNYKT